MTPGTVRVLLLTVTMGETVMVTAPVPRLRGAVPVKVKLPDQVSGLLLVRVSAPRVLLSRVPPERVRRPVPTAVELLRLRVPPERVSPPVKVLEVGRVRMPGRVF